MNTAKFDPHARIAELHANLERCYINKIKEMQKYLAACERHRRCVDGIIAAIDGTLRDLKFDVDNAENTIGMNIVYNGMMDDARIYLDIMPLPEFKLHKYNTSARAYEAISRQAERLEKRICDAIDTRYEASVGINPYSLMLDEKQANDHHIAITIYFKVR